MCVLCVCVGGDSAGFVCFVQDYLHFDMYKSWYVPASVVCFRVLYSVAAFVLVCKHETNTTENAR